MRLKMRLKREKAKRKSLEDSGEMAFRFLTGCVRCGHSNGRMWRWPKTMQISLLAKYGWR
jgi:hypothetical protein